MHSRWPRDVRAALGIGESTNAGQGWGCEQARDALQHRSPTPMHLFCCDALPQGAVDTFTRQHARGQVWELERDRWLVIATRLASTTRVCRVCEVVALCTPTASGRQCQPWWRRRWATPMNAMTTTNHEPACPRTGPPATPQARKTCTHTPGSERGDACHCCGLAVTVGFGNEHAP